MPTGPVVKIPELPEAEKAKGMKSAWHDDPVILERVVEVQRLKLEHPSWPKKKIAEELGIHVSTLAKDEERLQVLWLWHTSRQLEDLRAEAVQVYLKVQEEAWAHFRENPGTNWLKMILQAQDAINKLLGLEAPRRVQVDQEIVMDWGDPLRKAKNMEAGTARIVDNGR